MNRIRLLTHVAWFFIISASLIFSGGCNDHSPLPWEASPAYTQSDLAGTWYVHKLKSGTGGQWVHFTATVDSSGNITLSSCVNSLEGGVACPTNPVKWTINANGVVTESGPGAFETVHITMTSNKNFMAGTASEGASLYHMFIAQKQEDGTTYSDYDIKNKSFYFHAFYSGDENMWIHGEGATDSEGNYFILNETTPDGYYGPSAPADWALSLDSNGIVTGINDFHGFLSADKKTLVGTMSFPTSASYVLIVIQMPNEASSISQVAGTSFGHMLGTSASAADLFWAHATEDITSDGVITFSDWVNSDSVPAPPDNETLIINPMGWATLAGSNVLETSFHGQLSYDGKFLVATMTYADVYSFIVFTK
jgi:hypothetical protein